MRPDFDKVLCERPRRGGNITQRRREDNPKKQELLLSKEGMRRPHIRHWNGKELNEFLAPLFRYLQSKVGKPWNDTYSEIRTMMGKNPNAVQGHILQHIYGWGGVELHTVTKGNKVFNYPPHSNELNNGQLYVDDNGILRKYHSKIKKKNYKQRQEDKWMETARHLPNGNQARKINGLWFEIILSPILEHHILTSWSDINKYTRQRYPTYTVVAIDVLGTRGEVKDFVQKYKSSVYASSKKALNSKELKEYGLTND